MGQIKNTGWNDFTSAVSTGTPQNCVAGVWNVWGNASNALALPTSSRAQSTISINAAPQASQWLVVSNVGEILEQPYDKISGIELQIHKDADNTTAFINDCRVFIDKAGAAVGNSDHKSIDWKLINDYVTHGGPTDLWGSSFNYDDIHNSGFGARVEAYGAGINANTQGYIGHIQVKVHYEDNRMFCAM